MIEETESHIHLGLVYHYSCNWNAHVKHILVKERIRLNLLKSSKFKINRKALEKNNFSFILPVLVCKATKFGTTVQTNVRNN